VTALGTVTPPSGRQYELRLGRQRATVVEVGAGIREYEVDGRPVFDSFPPDAVCPYGCGQHPYLSPGTETPGAIDDCELTLQAATRIATDDRGLPTGRQSVAGTNWDFATGKRLGELQVDSAFTDLSRDDQGRAWVRLAGPDGHQAALWVDEHYPYLEIFTGDTLSPDRRRRGLGCEPMSCPPNAFATGTDVLGLEPGQSVTTRWGARLL
jgi:aldose 1-epimerase